MLICSHDEEKQIRKSFQNFREKIQRNCEVFFDGFGGNKNCQINTFKSKYN